jgi:hypothetical protein
VVGCRDTEPEPAHNRDLGGDGALLLPTASVWCEAAISKGKADWHPFSIEQALQQQAASLRPGEEPAGASERHQQIKDAIREMVDDYNDFAPEATVDELLEYYVEEQHDSLKQVFEAAQNFARTYATIRKELDARLPDARERVDAALAVLEAGATARLPVESITVLSDTEVAGKITGGSTQSAFATAPTCRFILLDDEWYIQLVALENFSENKPASDAELAMYKGLLQGLESGQMPAETVLEQVERAAQVARGLRKRTTGSGGNGADRAESDDESARNADDPEGG